MISGQNGHFGNPTLLAKMDKLREKGISEYILSRGIVAAMPASFRPRAIGLGEYPGIILKRSRTGRTGCFLKIGYDLKGFSRKHDSWKIHTFPRARLLVTCSLSSSFARTKKSALAWDGPAANYKCK